LRPEKEGLIKYQHEFTPSVALPSDRLRQIIAWRKIVYSIQLIGQDSKRYGGYGFGNISQRLDPFDVSAGTPRSWKYR
jgi:hypothetical protein